MNLKINKSYIFALIAFAIFYSIMYNLFGLGVLVISSATVISVNLIFKQKEV